MAAELDFLRGMYASPMAEWPALMEAQCDPEIEFVTRDGRQRGRDEFLTYIRGFVESTERRFETEWQVDDLIESGDGAIVALLTVLRRSRDSDGDYLKVWPANVWRFAEGKIVFFEGYPDHRRALEDHPRADQA